MSSSQDFKSAMGSPRKYYRWFRGHTHARLGSWFVPRAKLEKQFALIPMKVSGQWLWLKPYYALVTIKSAFSFGGTTTISYGTTSRSVSIFSFKSFLKSEGIIKNLCAEKKEAVARIKSWPEWFKKQVLSSQRGNYGL